MNKKEQKAQRAREEDIVLTKVLWWILGAVVLEALLLLLNRLYVNYTVDQIETVAAIRSVMGVLVIVLPLCFVALLAWTLAAWKGGRSVRLPAGLTVFAFALAVCAVVIQLFYDSGLSLLTVLVPAVAVLALIFYLYQREFFCAAVLSVLGLLGVRFAGQVVDHPVLAYGYLVVLAVILLAAAALFRMMQTNNGTLKLGDKQVELLPHAANYITLYLTCALVAAVVVGAVVLGSMMVLYGVLAAWLLILAVYYTVRLM